MTTLGLSKPQRNHLRYASLGAVCNGPQFWCAHDEESLGENCQSLPQVHHLYNKLALLPTSADRHPLISGLRPFSGPSLPSITMALIDRVPGDLNLYIGGYVMSTTVSNLPHGCGDCLTSCVACSRCGDARPSSKPTLRTSCPSCAPP